MSRVDDRLGPAFPVVGNRHLRLLWVVLATYCLQGVAGKRGEGYNRIIATR